MDCLKRSYDPFLVNVCVKQLIGFLFIYRTPLSDMGKIESPFEFRYFLKTFLLLFCAAKRSDVLKL